MSVPAVLTAAELRQAGRTPPVPLRIMLADGQTLCFRQLLRVLPGKRLAGVAELGGQTVFAKLFIAAGSERHWQREQAGIAALQAAGVATPALLLATPLSAGGHALISEFIVGAETIASLWQRGPRPFAADSPAVARLCAALPELARLHAQGVVHDDLHLGNLLCAAGRCYLIDGDAVRVVQAGQALPLAAVTDSLALLFAQLPPRWDAARADFLAAYASVPGAQLPAPAALQQAVDAVRERRLREFLGKVGRNCTQFAVDRSFSRFSVVVRDEQALLQPWLADPDALLASGRRLKSGATCTVADIPVGSGRAVVKRYNLKNWRHALSRAWRPSRAWHSWREAHRLAFYDIATPRPLALIEERRGPLRGRAFLLTAHCPGLSLLDCLSPDAAPPEALATALRELFRTLHGLRLTHGDLKASNLLWDGGRVVLIDLDAMRQHRSEATFRRAWQRDRARFLRNWPADSVLHRWLDRALP